MLDDVNAVKLAYNFDNELTNGNQSALLKKQAQLIISIFNKPVKIYVFTENFISHSI